MRVFVVVIEIRKYLKVEMYFCYQEIGTKPINGIGYDNVYWKFSKRLFEVFEGNWIWNRGSIKIIGKKLLIKGRILGISFK